MGASSFCSKSIRCCSLFYLFWGLIVISVRATAAERPAGRYLSQVGQTSVVYQVLLASFGNRLPEDVQVNLMLPPNHQNDPYLCSYPKTFAEANQTELRARAEILTERTALLAAVGGPCSTEDKARVLLQLQENVSDSLQVLILYETDRKFANWFISLAPDSEDVDPELDNVAVLYFPIRHIDRMKIQLNAVREGAPLLLEPGNENWSFQHRIEGSWIPVDPNDPDLPRGNGREYEASDDFIWIRYVLFSLLICSPCLRAFYLFYSGGGRIRFRRNEHGWITGLQFVPPMPHWLYRGRAPQPPEPISSTLTLEEFNKLPIVIYCPHLAENCDSPKAAPDGDASSQSSLEGGDPELGKAVTEEKNDGDSLAEVPIDVNVDCSSVDAERNTDEISSSEPKATSFCAPVLEDSDECVQSYHRFTECSICIDEFEPSERLILLPRCDHAFHKDCIRPWLLERQGRCPLCKTSVLQEENQTSESDRSVGDGSSSSSSSSSSSTNDES